MAASEATGVSSDAPAPNVPTAEAPAAEVPDSEAPDSGTAARRPLAPLPEWDARGLAEGLALLAVGAREVSVRAARDARVLAALTGRVPRVLNDERGGSAWVSFLREVAVARRCSDRVAASEVEFAVQLLRLPRALALLGSGELPLVTARALVDESLPASDGTLTRIDAEVSERACRLAPSRVRDAVRKVLLREEADAAAVAAGKATALRQARRTPLRDDQAEIALTGPAVPLAQAWEALDRDARALRAAGDGRTLDALRFDLAVDRLLADPAGCRAGSAADNAGCRAGNATGSGTGTGGGSSSGSWGNTGSGSRGGTGSDSGTEAPRVWCRVGYAGSSCSAASCWGR